MSVALRILFVTMSQSDAELVVRALETGGYAPSYVLLPVAAVPGALAAAQWDAIIAAAPGPALALTVDQYEMQARLAGQLEVMRGLSARLGEMEENTRRRLSAELHDRLGQSLFSLGLTLGAVRSELIDSAADQLVPRLDEALEVVDAISGQMRSVMVELWPPVLDDFGLLAALRSHAARFTQATGLATTVVGEELKPRLAPIVETALFRIAQEAFDNVLQHAKAHSLTLTLESLAMFARLTLADDGQGFSPQRPRALGEQARWGLLTMRERIEIVGGTMRVISAPGQGTRIILEVAR